MESEVDLKGRCLASEGCVLIGFYWQPVTWLHKTFPFVQPSGLTPVLLHSYPPPNRVTGFTFPVSVSSFLFHSDLLLHSVSTPDVTNNRQGFNVE